MSSQKHLMKPEPKKVGALSADGDMLHRAADQRQMYEESDRMDADQVRNNQGLEEGFGLSNLANIQEEHHRDRAGGGAISERENETERDTSPPGTIGDYQEVRSENVKITHGLKSRQNNKPPPGINKADSSDDEDTSVRALKSELTKQTAVAIVSPTIAMKETSRAMDCFNSNYDLLFRDFKAKLVDQYRQMRDLYMNEYQSNYD